MTIARIKSNTIRRLLLVMFIPPLTVLTFLLVICAALLAFWEELTSQLSQWRSTLLESVSNCWQGADVPE